MKIIDTWRILESLPQLILFSFIYIAINLERSSAKQEIEREREREREIILINYSGVAFGAQRMIYILKNTSCNSVAAVLWKSRFSRCPLQFGEMYEYRHRGEMHHLIYITSIS